jgi:hypothetical protein
VSLLGASAAAAAASGNAHGLLSVHDFSLTGEPATPGLRPVEGEAPRRWRAGRR